MEKKIPFEPVVMLVDATYLERVGTDLTEHFAPLVKRELPKAHLAVLLECLALDAGVPLGENKVQVIFIYDEADKRFSFCDPSDLEKELHATAFKSQLGEFSLYAFQPSGFATREDLFLESFQLLGESKEVRRVIAVPDEDGYGERLASYINKVGEGKEGVTVFGMNPPVYQGKYAFEMLGFAVLQALGIRADEL
ncbi:DUF6621 family protein [Bacteroides sp. An322]|uniref:DUF6621 family protein n=1 Tax=Bacteroides sp. An322 TaxID=1965632 RepID=UPI000B39229F|nr:DUF6621 family protein [Bacteroides sp. An322]OUO17053.1 hypothetical protein B5F91_12600 [Bacteroides sp. An322]